MRSRLLALVLVFAVATPTLADPMDMFRRAREAMGSGRPSPQLLRQFMELPNFEMTVNATESALRAFNIHNDAAKALLGITKVTKSGDRITIRTKRELILPVMVDGKVKGWVKLNDPVSFRIRNSGAKGVVIDDFKGIAVGPWKSLTVDMKHVKKADWQPAGDGSNIAITAGWWIFSASFSIALPPPPPSRTPGLTNRIGRSP